MAVAYFDCFAGAAGDMIVASLLDAGADLDALREEIAKLALGDVHVEADQVRRGSLAGMLFRVHEHHHHHHHHDHGHDHADGHGHKHRHLGDILKLIDDAALAERVAERARRIFRRLAEAEAKVHGTGIEEVHFHEVGAVDSIVDIVSACVAMELLGIEKVFSSPLALGSGTITCAHGEMPAPAPATAQLVVGAAVHSPGIDGEATTPTGAAILTTLAESYGPAPSMRVSAVGFGAGTRETGALPNLLRVFVGELVDDADLDSVVELSANLDDCSGEVLGAAIGRLLSAGCLDAWASPVVMKKSRPGWVLSVLCEPADVAEAEEILFAETTTFGIRRRCCRRAKLRRRHETVETPYGPVRMKLGRRGEREITAAPEFDDCRRAAEAHGVAVREVLAEAEALYRQARALGD